jgi:hypothetical protein
MTRVLAEELVGPGIEVFLGLKVDPSFGPVAIFGAGGVDLEQGGGHVIFSLARDPTDRLDRVRRAVREHRVTHRSAHWDGLIDAIDSIATWWLEELAPAELDVNPVIVGDGHAWVVDAVAIQRSGLIAAPALPSGSR